MKPVVLLAALCVGALGCLDSVGPPLPTPGPAPTPPLVQPDQRGHTDAEFWRALAVRVEAGRYPDTDRLLAVVVAAKEAGDVTNAMRLQDVLPDAAQTNRPIDETNRRDIATKLRALK